MLHIAIAVGLVLGLATGLLASAGSADTALYYSRRVSGVFAGAGKANLFEAGGRRPPAPGGGAGYR